jgi:hypothetical protein
MYPAGERPRRATSDVNSTLPIAAVRHCEAIRSASALGWLFYMPMDTQIQWDGAGRFQWCFDDDDDGWTEWEIIAPEVTYPGFADYWNEHAPEFARDYEPPMLAVGQDLGILQVWTGAIVRTRSDYSLLVCDPINDGRRSLGYDMLSGIIATDEYGPHLFVNLRFHNTAPIFIQKDRPLFQAIPIRRSEYTPALFNDYTVGDFASMPEERWDSYRRWICDRPMNEPPGRYIRNERHREKRDK